MAPDHVGLEQVEELARAGPDQFDIWVGTEHFDGGGHYGHGIAARIGDASREYGYISGRPAGEYGGYLAHLVEGQQRGGVYFNAGVGQPADQIDGGFPLGIGDGDFDVDIIAPAGNLAGLTFHLRKRVGEDLEGN